MLEAGIKVMFQRDKIATDKMQIATITRAGCTIGEQYNVQAWPEWSFHHEQTNEMFRPSRVPPTHATINQ